MLIFKGQLPTFLEQILMLIALKVTLLVPASVPLLQVCQIPSARILPDFLPRRPIGKLIQYCLLILELNNLRSHLLLLLALKLGIDSADRDFGDFCPKSKA